MGDVSVSKIDCTFGVEGSVRRDGVYCNEIKLNLREKTTIEGGKEAATPLIALHGGLKGLQGATNDELGDMIVSLPNAAFVSPKGYYNAELYQKHMVIKGKKSKASAEEEWVIPHEGIKGMYYLKAPGDSRWFILQLLKAIRVGSQTFANLTIEVSEEIMLDGDNALKLNMDALSDEQKAMKDARDDTVILSEEMSGVASDLVKKLLRGITMRSIVSPPEGSVPIDCSNKTGARGCMFFLKKALLFAPTPALPFQHTQLEKIVFDGYMDDSATIGAAFHIKGQKAPYNFLGIARGDAPALRQYIEEKGIILAGLEAERTNLLDSDDEMSEGSLADQGDNDGGSLVDSNSDSGDEKKKKKRKHSGKDKKAKKARTE